MIRFLLFAIFFNFNLYVPAALGQNSRTGYALLWKVSGNGLKKPSYLFGTMHLRDKRVFDFSDSVLVKLQECETFAMEVSPDTIVKAFFNMMIEYSNKDTTNRLKKSLTAEEYKLLEEKLFKEKGIHLDKMKDKSPDKISNLLTYPDYKKTDKFTFLDAYLYRVALGEKKKIEGLESLEGHMEGVSNSYEAEVEQLKQVIHAENPDESTDGLTEIYWKGDMEEILNISSSWTSYQNILSKRNRQMTERIDQLIRQSTAFIAVGAAHLPGEEGLIQLLEKKGYTVTKVHASFTGLAAKYKEKPVDIEWSMLAEKEDGYSILFPSKPLKYPVNDQVPVNMYVCPDFASGLYYFTISVPVVASANPGPEKLLDKFLKKMFSLHESKISNTKKVLYQGLQGAEAEFMNIEEGMYGKVRILARDSYVYLQIALTYQKALLAGGDAVKFFQSFNILPLEKVGEKEFASEEGAFEVISPVQLREFKQTEQSENGPVKTVMLLGEDNATQMAYYAGYYQLPPGTIMVNDSFYLSKLAELFTNAFHVNITDVKPINYNEHYPGLSIKANNDKTVCHIHFFLRGSRPYFLFTTSRSDQLNEKAIDAFLNSFRMREYKKTEWITYTSSDDNFEIRLPGEPVIEYDSIGFSYSGYTQKSFRTSDPNTGIVYLVNITNHSPYYYKNKEKFYGTYQNRYYSNSDSVLWLKDRMIGGIKGKELLIKEDAVHALKRVLFVPKGNSIFEISSFYPEEYDSTGNPDAFFNSFGFADKNPGTTIFDSKAKDLLTDISSSDTLIQEKAQRMLSGYSFEEYDLPLILASLDKKYPDDTSSHYGSIRAILLRELPTFKDRSAIDFIRKLYPSLSDYPTLQIGALKALLEIQQKESKELFLELIKTSVPDISYLPYNFFQPLEDSVALNAYLLPEIFFLHKNKYFRNDIYSLTSRLLDSNQIVADFAAPYLKDILYYLQEDLKNAHEYFKATFNVRGAIKLMRYYIADSVVQTQLWALLQNPDPQFAYPAMLVLLENHQQIGPKVIEKFASSDGYRNRLYKDLEKLGQLQLFPSKWLKQELFAKSDLYNHLEEWEEITVQKLEPLGNQVLDYQGKTGRFYLFKFLHDDYWYTGISGPFPENKKEIVVSGEATSTLFEPLKNKSIKDHYKELLGE